MLPIPSIKFLAGAAMGAAAGYAFGRVYEAKARGLSWENAVRSFLRNPLPDLSRPAIAPVGVKIPAPDGTTVEYFAPARQM